MFLTSNADTAVWKRERSDGTSPKFMEMATEPVVVPAHGATLTWLCHTSGLPASVRPCSTQMMLAE